MTEAETKHSTGNREYTVALLLKNTYYTEASQYANDQVGFDKAIAPSKWDEEFGDIGPPDDAELSAEADPPKKNKKNKVWLKIARLVIANNLDPEAFVRRQFDAFSGVGDPPMPDMMAGPNALKRYDEGCDIAVQEIKVALGMQKQTMRTNIALSLMAGCRQEKAWADALYDLDLAMTALFRFCMAVSMAKQLKGQADDAEVARFDSIAATHKIPAAVQYVHDAKTYDEIWGTLIPRKFAAEAEDIYRKFFQR